MKKILLLVITIATLFSITVLPSITNAGSKYTVTLNYIDTNTGNPLHTTIIKDFEGGTKIKLADYEYDLATKYKIYGYTYSDTKIGETTITDKNVKIDADTQVTLNYNLTSKYQYVVRYFTVSKYGNKVLKVRNIQTDSVKNWGSADTIEVTAGDISQGTYKGYKLTYNGLGEIKNNVLSSVTSGKKVKVKKAENFRFVCIDFFYEVELSQGTNVVKKTAEWSDTNKTKVKMEISVTPVKNPPLSESDIMVVFDRSGTSVGHWVQMDDNAILGKDKEQDNKEHSGTVAQFLEGINLNGNTISYIAYSSRLFAFNKKGLVFASNHNYAPGLGYSKGSSSAPNYHSTSGSEASERRTLYNSMVAAYGKEIDAWMGTSLNDQIEGAVKLQTSIKDSTTSATSWGGGIRINYNNTNFDLPMMFSEYYFDKLYEKGQNGRKSFILFITDGWPYPGNQSERSTQYNKIKQYIGKAGAYEGILWDGDCAGNKYSPLIAKDLRDKYGTEIYMIVMPNNTSASFIASLTNRSGYDNSASKNTNDHVEIVADGMSGTQLSNAVKTALDKILTKWTQEGSSPTVIEDTINDEILKAGKDNISIECYIGGTRNKDQEKKVTISGNKVTWDITNYLDGLKPGSTIPEFKLVIYAELKDEFKYSAIKFNTNKIDNEVDSGCTYTYPGGKDEVTTPWLEKEGGRLKINWLVVDDDGKVIKTIDESDTSVSFGKGSVLQSSSTKLATKHIYQGHNVVTGVSKPTTLPSSINNSEKANYETTKDDPDHTINFYYKYKKVNATISYRHAIKNADGQIIFTFPNTTTSKRYVGWKDAPNPYVLKNDTEGDPIAEKHTISKVTDIPSSAYEYKGYYVEKGKVFTSKNTVDDTGNKVELELSASATDYAVTFVYMFKDLLPDIEVVHHVETAPEREIYSGISGYTDKRVSLKFNDYMKYFGLTVEETVEIYDIMGGSGTMSSRIKSAIAKLSGKTFKCNPPNSVPLKLKSLGSYVMQEDRMRIKDTNIKVRESKYALGDTGYVSMETNDTTDGGKIFKESSFVTLLTSEAANVAFFNSNKNLISIKYDYVELRTMTIKHVDIFTGEVIAIDGKVYEESTEFEKDSLQVAKAHTEGKEQFGGYTFINKYDITKPSFVKNVTEDKSEVTIKMEDDVTITFYYNKIPEIDGDVTPEIEPPVGEIPDPGDPDPDKPGNPYTANKSKLITLDEIFKLDVNIKYYNRITEGSKIECTMPFDVYYFGTYGKTGTGGKFVPKGTTLVIENVGNVKDEDENKSYTLYFRLPSWVVEKLLNDVNPYDVELHIDDTTNQAWIEDKAIRIGVVGRLYDFTVTNLNEGSETDWKASLFANANYGREYKADILPIGQRSVTPNISSVFDKAARNNNTQPRTSYGLFLGGQFYFSINTKGIKSDSIKIVPKLYYYDTNGVQKSVTYNYTDSMGRKVPFADNNGVIKANDGTFTTALNDTFRTSSQEVVAEIKKATDMKALNNVLNITNGNTFLTYRSFVNQYQNFTHMVSRDFGKYNQLLIPNTLRMPYLNYEKTDLAKSEVNKIGYETYNKTTKAFNNTPVLQYVDNNGADKTTYNNTYLGPTKAGSLGINENSLINSLGHWYATYYLPRTLEVVDGTGKVLTEGSIVVAFKIATKDANGYTYINYHNGTNDSGQWKKENADINAEKVKINLPVSDKTVDFTISNGYYPVAVYSTRRLDKDVSVTH